MDSLISAESRETWRQRWIGDDSKSLVFLRSDKRKRGKDGRAGGRMKEWETFDLHMASSSDAAARDVQLWPMFLMNRKP